MRPKYVVTWNSKGEVTKIIKCPTDFDVSIWLSHLQRRARKWSTGQKITVEDTVPEDGRHPGQDE
ncbi:MAG: hypothetical protein ACE1ZC_03280 [Nitrososphaerales archaeon]